MRVFVRAGDQAGPNGVADDVVGKMRQVFVSPYGMVMESWLPQRTAAFSSAVNLQRGAALCPRDDAAEVHVRRQSQHPVNMVGHDDETLVFTTAFVGTIPDFTDDRCGRRRVLEYGLPGVADRGDDIDPAAL